MMHLPVVSGLLDQAYPVGAGQPVGDPVTLDRADHRIDIVAGELSERREVACEARHNPYLNLARASVKHL